MKIHTTILIGLFVLPMSIPVSLLAEAPVNSGVALGFQGIGNIYQDGFPTLRWRKSQKNAFDLTLDLDIDNSSQSQSYDSESQNYGIDLGWVRNIRENDSVKIGLLWQVGYTYGHSSADYPPSWNGITSSTMYQVSAGVGPDLEIFIKKIPGLSIGATGIVEFNYSETKSKKNFSPGTSLSESKELNIRGQVLTLRYYF